MIRGCFITGTDTEIGKTHVTTLLLKALKKAGFPVTAIKPVQTGCLRIGQELSAPDVIQYRSSGVPAFALESFEAAASPQLAARLEGKTLSVHVLSEQLQQRLHKMDFAVMEGAGGVFTPLNENESFIDLMRAWQLPVILVVGNKLGCLNHARLTLQALSMAGIPLLGIIANRAEPLQRLDAGAGDDIRNQERFLHDNIHALAQLGLRYQAPLLATIGYNETDPDLSGVIDALARLSPTEAIRNDLAFDRDHLWHPYTKADSELSAAPVVFAQDRTLYLADGKKLIDGTSSWWCAMHGYGQRDLIEAIQRQAARLSHVMFGGLTHNPAIELGRRLLKLLPHGLEHIFYVDSGSVAVEVAMKMAVQYWRAQGNTRRRLLLTPKGGYHGDTHGAMSVCDPSEGMHTLFHGTIVEQIFVERPSVAFNEPFDPNCLDSMRRTFQTRGEDIAAVILEPICQGAGGMWFYHPEYLKGVRELCDQFGALLILDEIATGFGRTGRAFACEWADIVPDIMCIGKGLTGGMLSMAATIVNDRVAETISCANAEHGGGAFMHGPTFMANPLASAVACASLDRFSQGIWKEQTAELQAQMLNELGILKTHEAVQDVRVLGAIGVVQMKQAVNSPRLQRYFIERGLWIRPFGSLLYLMPPYNTTKDELHQLCQGIVDAVQEGIFL